MSTRLGSITTKEDRENKGGLCRYVVELFCWNTTTNTYERKDDCVMTLNTIDGAFELTSDEKTNGKVYVKANINKDEMHIISRESHKIASMYNISQNSDTCDKNVITFDYEIRVGGSIGKMFGIRFDPRSSASENNFYTEFSKIKSKYQSVDYYPSGNIRLEGMKTSKGFTGTCIEYFDSKIPRIKYLGEFEDDIYDGEGEFFSQDCNIRLLCKNICAGKPNGIGRLVIGRNHDRRDINMKDFSHLQSKSNDYTKRIYADIEPDYEEILELMNFSSLSLEERTMFLFREFRKIKADMKNKIGNQKSVERMGSYFGF